MPLPGAISPCIEGWCALDPQPTDSGAVTSDSWDCSCEVTTMVMSYSATSDRGHAKNHQILHTRKAPSSTFVVSTAMPHHGGGFWHACAFSQNETSGPDAIVSEWAVIRRQSRIDPPNLRSTVGDYSLSIVVSPDELLKPCGTSVKVFRLDRAFRGNADWEEFLTATVE